MRLWPKRESKPVPRARRRGFVNCSVTEYSLLDREGERVNIQITVEEIERVAGRVRVAVTGVTGSTHMNRAQAAKMLPQWLSVDGVEWVDPP